jgi:hypothetical protein
MRMIQCKENLVFFRLEDHLKNICLNSINVSEEANMVLALFYDALSTAAVM